MKLTKVSPRQVIIALAIAIVLYYLVSTCTTSTYSVKEKTHAPSGFGTEEAASTEGDASSCEMNAGTGLASSLLPREVASQEDFGEFAPEDVLEGQNFLEPRQQIGFPETVGGALRNANQQVRADPPNPKEPFVWNNSTISPDGMRRPLC
tara:strand:- start:3060 stop:3509 length:450 start_codon:yes stop_codon:yes gene_type:complete